MNPLDPEYPIVENLNKGFTIGQEVKKMDIEHETKIRMNQNARNIVSTERNHLRDFGRDIPEIKHLNQDINNEYQRNNNNKLIDNISREITQNQELLSRQDKLYHQQLYAEQMNKKLEKIETKPMKKVRNDILKENIQTFANNKQAALAHKLMIERSKILNDTDRVAKKNN